MFLSDKSKIEQCEIHAFHALSPVHHAQSMQGKTFAGVVDGRSDLIFRRFGSMDQCALTHTARLKNNTLS